MNLVALRKAEIMQTLSSVSDDHLEQVRHYVESLLTPQHVRSSVSLQGIWAGRGFEKLTDLSAEVKAVSDEMVRVILARKI
jgi:hypothetical protein